ncbi:MAG TPA: hypothetical protein VKU01_09205 [Bryobacteraceae bacterium]|nr:hypothetical protein [Bryobacteraceae bacterium]
MDRPVIHISEQEAVHDFNSVLRLVDAGSDVVVDRDSGAVAISPATHASLVTERLRFARGPASKIGPELAAREAAERDARDKMIYELHANELNAEAADVLEYQVLPE